MIGPVADVADLVMGCEERDWLFRGQNIGPTDKIICCKFVHVHNILRHGASTSPPNPTGIKGGEADH